MLNLNNYLDNTRLHPSIEKKKQSIQSLIRVHALRPKNRYQTSASLIIAHNRKKSSSDIHTRVLPVHSRSDTRRSPFELRPNDWSVHTPNSRVTSKLRVRGRRGRKRRKRDTRQRSVKRVAPEGKQRSGICLRKIFGATAAVVVCF